MESLDDWVELVGAVEAAAVALDAPIRIEGYRPPRDARLGELSVTPDPGVIEVNVQPVASWRALVDQTTHLYEAARGVRLAAEKFMIDGKHTGTGGGNHVVLGGASWKPLLPESLQGKVVDRIAKIPAVVMLWNQTKSPIPKP